MTGHTAAMTGTATSAIRRSVPQESGRTRAVSRSG